MTYLVPPPVDAVTPATANLVTTVVTGALVLISLIYALWIWKTRGSALYFVVLLSGAVCMLSEPWLDIISQIWFPSDGWIVFEAYGRTMTLWGLFSYTVFFGTQTFLILELLRRGVTRGKFWAGMLGVWGFNVALEATVLSRKLYFYYGEQPLRIGEFPAVWIVLNSIGVALAAAILFKFRSFFTGWRVIAAIAVAPLSQLVGLWVGYPHFYAINSDASMAVKTAASAASIIIGLFVLDVIIRVLVQSPAEVAEQPAQVRARQAARV